MRGDLCLHAYQKHLSPTPCLSTSPCHHLLPFWALIVVSPALLVKKLSHSSRESLSLLPSWTNEIRHRFAQGDAYDNRWKHFFFFFFVFARQPRAIYELPAEEYICTTAGAQSRQLCLLYFSRARVPARPPFPCAAPTLSVLLALDRMPACGRPGNERGDPRRRCTGTRIEARIERCAN